ncbi:hypothetical protein, partial [Bacillus toyonensis]|uniref:hypothetical protein n=1 Tax=Bacillus toyonensis TaxID=155322 RepID=UPI0021D3CB28
SKITEKIEQVLRFYQIFSLNEHALLHVHEYPAIFHLGAPYMPINLRILTSPPIEKNVILSKQVKLERMTFFMNLSIQSELQLFAEELHRYLILQKSLLEN